MTLKLNRKKTTGFSLLELIAVIAIIGILLGFLIPAIQQVREAARNSKCQNNIRNVTLAAINYESARQHFPPGNIAYEGVDAFLVGPGGSYVGTPFFILPFIDFNSLGGTLRTSTSLNQPINGVMPYWKTDEKWLKFKSEIFQCPSSNARLSPNVVLFHQRIKFGYGVHSRGWSDYEPTNYVSCAGYVGARLPGWDETGNYAGLFTHRSSNDYSDISDGSSQTVAFGEVNTTRVYRNWADKPNIGYYGWACGGLISGFGAPGNESSFNSEHRGATNASMADGATHSINHDVDFTAWIYLTGKHDGHRVSVNDF